MAHFGYKVKDTPYTRNPKATMYGGTALGAGLGLGASLAVNSLLKKKGVTGLSIGGEGLAMGALVGGALAAPFAKRKTVEEEPIPRADIGDYGVDLDTGKMYRNLGGVKGRLDW